MNTAQQVADELDGENTNDCEHVFDMYQYGYAYDRAKDRETFTFVDGSVFTHRRGIYRVGVSL